MTFEDVKRIRENPTAEDVDNQELHRLIDIAIEKQIPKKPTPHKVEGGKIKIGNGWWCEGTTVHKCPNCNEWITKTYDYCIKCGQKLDWGDGE
jgi:hypothetical protein